MKEILIAGISGGIGKAIAEQLLRDDPEIRIWGLCRDPGSAVFDGLQGGQGSKSGQNGRLQLMAWDARETDSAALAQTLKDTLPEDLALDTVFYAAGILHGEALAPEKKLDDIRAEALLHAFQVNAVGFPMLVQALQPWLRHRGFKRLLAVSAKVGSITDNGKGGWYAYRASKAALNMLVRNLAIELARRFRPVACVAVHPGTTETRLSAPFGQSLGTLTVHTPADTAANMITIARRLGEADNGRFINWDGQDLPW